MNKVVTYALFLLSFLTPFHLTAGPSSDTFEMRVIAELLYASDGDLVCGDADHDGQPEFYAMRWEDWRGYALEHIGGNQFDTTFIPGGLLFSDLGDADRDGKTDLLFLFPLAVINVFESPDSSSLPTQRVWCDSFEYAARRYACLAEIDRDSACELVISDEYENRVRLYENIADNQYLLKTKLPCLIPSALAPTDDLDRDGKPELVIGTSTVRGRLYFYETVADDSFECVAVSFLEPYEYVSGLAAAPDIDQDGHNELIAVAGTNGNAVIVAVYESPCNDSFAIVWSCVVSGSRGNGMVAVGDIDGDSVPEFAVCDGINVRLFRCTGKDQFEQFWQVENEAPEVAIYDINADGKKELLYSYRTDTLFSTVIREYFKLGLAEQQLAELERVSVPAVVARGKVVRVNWEGGKGNGARIEVLDAAGRVVAVPKGAWNTTFVAPGAYFVRVSLGSQSVTRKVLVVE